jgi:hypothetical protein
MHPYQVRADTAKAYLLGNDQTVGRAWPKTGRCSRASAINSPRTQIRFITGMWILAFIVVFGLGPVFGAQGSHCYMHETLDGYGDTYDPGVT